MEITQTLHVTNPKDWRDWLKRNYKTGKEIWLVYNKKGTGKPRIEYNDAVEEALCFGWIQSRLKPLDPQSFAVRFSPRHKGSIWSLPNLKRVRRLITEGRMTESGLAVLPADFGK